MTRTGFFAAVLVASALQAAGCTTEQMYNTVQQSKRSQCDQLKALPDRQRCLNETGPSHDAYQRERAKSVGPAP